MILSCKIQLDSIRIQSNSNESQSNSIRILSNSIKFDQIPSIRSFCNDLRPYSHAFYSHLPVVPSFLTLLSYPAINLKTSFGAPAQSDSIKFDQILLNSIRFNKCNSILSDSIKFYQIQSNSIKLF